MERKRCLLQLCDICKRVPTTFWRFKDQYLSALQNCPPPYPRIWILFWSWWPQRKRMLLWKNQCRLHQKLFRKLFKSFSRRKRTWRGAKCPLQTRVGEKPQQRDLLVNCCIWCDLQRMPRVDCDVPLRFWKMSDPNYAISVFKNSVWDAFRIPDIDFVLLRGPIITL